MKLKVAMMWSGGKDSSLALYKILNNPKFEVCYLVSTFSKETERLSMHGIPQEIIEWQAQSIGLPLIKMFTDGADHASYEKSMQLMLNQLKSEGIFDVVFGDIFLEDLRKYREDNLMKVNVKALFPLWKIATKEIMQEFLGLEFKTICCCVDYSKLDSSFLGQIIDEKWVARLPKEVDVCGENGEFHTLCINGPIFNKPLSVDFKGIIEKKYLHDHQTFEFGFADLMLKD